MKKAYPAIVGAFGKGARRYALGIITVAIAVTIAVTACTAWPRRLGGTSADGEVTSSAFEARKEYQESRVRAYRHAAAVGAIVAAQREYQASRTRAYRHEAATRAIVAAQLEVQASRQRAFEQSERERALTQAQREYQDSRVRAYRSAAVASGRITTQVDRGR